MNVAADIDDSSRQERNNLLEETSVTSLSRRVDDERCLVACPFEVLGHRVEQSLGSARMERDVVDRVDGRVMVGVRDRGRVNLDAANFRAAETCVGSGPKRNARMDAHK